MSRWQPWQERFWANVDKRGDEDCWPWTGCRDRHGYGKIYFDGKLRTASRVSWLLANGAEANGCVCHRCDNPICVNPAHLFVGTQADNLADMRRKGRYPQGEQAACAKLTAEAVREIIRLRGTVSQAELARRYSVSQSAISLAQSRSRWGWLDV